MNGIPAGGAFGADQLVPLKISASRVLALFSSIPPTVRSRPSPSSTTVGYQREIALFGAAS